MQVIRDKQTWDRIVKSFMKWDIYYLYDYAVSLEQHGDGAPCLLYFETDKCRMCYVLMINDISHSKSFRGYLEDNLLFDAETPYGYGGPMIEGDFDKITREFPK